MRWGYNDKTYFFSGDYLPTYPPPIEVFDAGTMYWRFDEEEQYVELDYPRDIVMWRGIPYNIDAVFQWHNKKTCSEKKQLKI